MSRSLHATVLLAALAAACSAPPAQPAAPPAPAPPPDTRAADEATIRNHTRDWSAAAKAKDIDKFLSFYAPDGVLMVEMTPDARGTAALRDGVTALFKDPNFALSFETDSVVVARSGDMAYETGHYTLSVTGPDKKPMTQPGNFVVVWRKQADGTWKVAVDAPVSDPPAAAAK
jgi:uncharacterized protein (TIGR02246 family)